MELRRTELIRRQIKSSEGEFIWESKNLYELSPKVSEQILVMQTQKQEKNLGKGV